MVIKRVIFPHSPAYGGPGSFQIAFEEQLNKLGINKDYHPTNATENDIVLIVNGTKKIFWLLKQKFFYKSKIILRIDGKIKLAIKDSRLPIHITRMILIKLCRLISNGVIYQSRFSIDEWTPKNYEKNIVIYNGHKNGIPRRHAHYREECTLIVAEGVIQGKIAEKFLPILLNYSNLMIFGLISNKLSPQLQNEILNSKSYQGVVPKNDLHSVFKNNKCIFVSLEYNANCPNIVIEAMSYGVPVLGFKTGSMEELVPTKETLLNLDILGDNSLPHKFNKLFNEVKERYEDLSYNNLTWQREQLSVEKMTERYLEFFKCS